MKFISKNIKLNSIKNELIHNDPILEPVLKSYVPLSETKTFTSDYLRLVKIVIAQQLSGAAADTIFFRLEQTIGKNFSPEQFLRVKASTIQNAGVSRAKFTCICGISALLQSNPLYFENLKKLNAQEKISKLTDLKGIGMWTATIFCMDGENGQDLFPLGDGTLKTVIKEIYQLSEIEYEEQILNITEKWSPYKTLVCKSLWYFHDNSLRKK